MCDGLLFLCAMQFQFIYRRLQIRNKQKQQFQRMKYEHRLKFHDEGTKDIADQSVITKAYLKALINGRQSGVTERNGNKNVKGMFQSTGPCSFHFFTFSQRCHQRENILKSKARLWRSTLSSSEKNFQLVGLYVCSSLVSKKAISVHPLSNRKGRI